MSFPFLNEELGWTPRILSNHRVGKKFSYWPTNEVQKDLSICGLRMDPPVVWNCDIYIYICGIWYLYIRSLVEKLWLCSKTFATSLQGFHLFCRPCFFMFFLRGDELSIDRSLRVFWIENCFSFGWRDGPKKGWAPKTQLFQCPELVTPLISGCNNRSFPIVFGHL